MNRIKKRMKMDLQKFALTQSIFDFVVAPEIAAYWEARPLEHPPYLGEELFPNDKQLGTDLTWFVGQTGAPVALKPSAFGARAIPRGRREFDKVAMTLAFFKESYYIDEHLRQELLKVLQTGNQLYITTVLERIFNDIADLVDGAKLRREISRMELLTTGGITIEGNGQKYTLDYGFPEENIGYAEIPWSDYENSNPVEDIKKAIQHIVLSTGIRPTRVVVNSTTLGHIVANKKLNRTMHIFGGGDIIIDERHVKNYLSQTLGLTVGVYDHVYKDDAGEMKKFMPDNKFILLPPNALGKTWFGTTPEEADLMASNVANVSIVDTGTAVTTTKKTDPVTVETKVSMLTLPSFENIRQVYILNTIEKPKGSSAVVLEGLTVPELRAKAKESNIPINTRMKKVDLIKALMGNEEDVDANEDVTVSTEE